MTSITNGTGCTQCVDLVASEFDIPEVYFGGTPMTVTFQAVNIGDSPTALNALTDRLLSLAAISDGTISGAAISSSLPGVTCTVDITGGQLATTWNDRPDLVTLTVGEQNSTIVNLITQCFDDVKSHDFAGGASCAGAILGNTSLYSNPTSNLPTKLQQYRVIMAGRPKLVVAVTGYPNPYPKSLDAAARVAELCPPLIDTIPACTARWVQLSPALDLIDQLFQKLNTTIANAVAPFANSSAGRFVFVSTYDKLRDHCMKMEVSFKTEVEHPEESGAVHEHDSPSAVNFGCDAPWFVAGSDGTDVPFYLEPAAIGVLVTESQTTSGMGVYPNDDGHKCISDLIWEADTIDPGTTPLKWKLGVPEAPNLNICQ